MTPGITRRDTAYTITPMSPVFGRKQKKRKKDRKKHHDSAALSHSKSQRPAKAKKRPKNGKTASKGGRARSQTVDGISEESEMQLMMTEMAQIKEERDRLRQELVQMQSVNSPNIRGSIGIRIDVCIPKHANHARSRSLTELELDALSPVPSEATPHSKDDMDVD